MRATRWLLGSCTALTVVASVAAGCGSSSNSANPQDSGTADVTMEATMMEAAAEAAPETGPEAAADAACVPDANINNIMAPDASFGDAGATAAKCLACFQSSCGATITKCNMSCACVSAFQGFTSCIGSGGSLQTCGAGLLSGSTGLGLADVICAAGCATPAICGVTIPTDSGMAGETSPGDGSGGDSAAD